MHQMMRAYIMFGEYSHSSPRWCGVVWCGVGAPLHISWCGHLRFSHCALTTFGPHLPFFFFFFQNPKRTLRF